MCGRVWRGFPAGIPIFQEQILQSRVTSPDHVVETSPFVAEIEHLVHKEICFNLNP